MYNQTKLIIEQAVKFRGRSHVVAQGKGLTKAIAYSGHDTPE